MNGAVHKTIVAYNDEHRLKFTSYSHAAKFFDVSINTIKNRIVKNQIIEGYNLSLMDETECSDICLADTVDSDKYINYHNEKDMEIDLNIYNPLNYNVRYGRVSITPCPYKYDDKPFIGSARCASCQSFRGRNKKNHQVACNNNRK